MSGEIDVLGLGAVTVDFVSTVPEMPREGGRMLIQEFAIHDGGLVGTAIVAAARLGGRIAYAGKLGHSPLSIRAIEALEKEGIHTSLIVRDPNAEPILAFIYTNINDGRRTILWTRHNVQFPRQSEFPDKQWYKRTRVLLFDGESGQAGIEAAKVAREHKIPVVVDIIQNDAHVPEAMRYSTYIIISERFAALCTGKEKLKDMLHALRKDQEQTIIITRGDKGCVVLTGDDEFQFGAYKVNTVDGTGCGDTFHGAFALGIARKMSVIEAATLASAAGALCATKLGGRPGLPTRPELDKFVQSQPELKISDLE